MISQWISLFIKQFSFSFGRHLIHGMTFFGVLIMVFISFPSHPYAAQTKLVWDENNESDTVAGYYVYCGTSSGQYEIKRDIQNQNMCDFTGLEEGKVYYFAVKAYNSAGEESDFSDEFAYAIPISNTDTDGDGLTDYDEIHTYGTDPGNADTDGDGIMDSPEPALRGNGRNPDYDNDSLINLRDHDSDGDSFSAGIEVNNGSIPETGLDNSETATILIEAEEGFLAAPMEINHDSEASGSEYIEVPDRNGDSADPLADSGYAEYTFDVPVDGYYVIWGRVLARNDSSDSFFVSIDNGDYLTWHVPNSKAWAWDVISERDEVDDTNDSEPVTYFLDKGEHVLIIKLREEAAGFDRVIITNDLDLIPDD